MPNSGSLLVAYGMANLANTAAVGANKRAIAAEERAADEKRRRLLSETTREASSSELQDEVDALIMSNKITKGAYQGLLAKSEEKDSIIAEKDALILEWMHSNEAFKLLARQYGKKLGVSVEQQTEDRVQKLVDVAEEDPKFANTRISAKAKSSVKK